MKNRITTGLFRPGKKKLSFMTTMFCLDCEFMWDASNISHPCPRCASKEVLAASRWAPAKYGMPNLPGVKHDQQC
ncbi:MAG: hypothetical protein K8S18_18935 [Desulfobacula sp.]|nr:hypothetical protein [Desulfobacula sp.]